MGEAAGGTRVARGKCVDRLVDLRVVAGQLRGDPACGLQRGECTVPVAVQKPAAGQVDPVVPGSARRGATSPSFR